MQGNCVFIRPELWQFNGRIWQRNDNDKNRKQFCHFI